MWKLLADILLGVVGVVALLWIGHYVETHTYDWKVFVLRVIVFSGGIIAMGVSAAGMFIASAHAAVSIRPMASLGSIIYSMIMIVLFIRIVLRGTISDEDVFGE